MCPLCPVYQISLPCTKAHNYKRRRALLIEEVHSEISIHPIPTQPNPLYSFWAFKPVHTSGQQPSQPAGQQQRRRADESTILLHLAGTIVVDVDGLFYVLVNLLWNSNWREIWILYQSVYISSEVGMCGNLNFWRLKHHTHQQKEFCRWQICFMKSGQAPLLTLCYHQTPFWKWRSKWRKNYLSEWKWKLFVWVKTRMICLSGNTNYLSEWKQELFVWVETRII